MTHHLFGAAVKEGKTRARCPPPESRLLRHEGCMSRGHTTNQEGESAPSSPYSAGHQKGCHVLCWATGIGNQRMMAAWRSCATRKQPETMYCSLSGEGGSTHFSHGGRCWLAQERTKRARVGGGDRFSRGLGWRKRRRSAAEQPTRPVPVSGWAKEWRLVRLQRAVAQPRAARMPLSTCHFHAMDRLPKSPS